MRYKKNQKRDHAYILHIINNYSMHALANIKTHDFKYLFSLLENLAAYDLMKIVPADWF